MTMEKIGKTHFGCHNFETKNRRFFGDSGATTSHFLLACTLQNLTCAGILGSAAVAQCSDEFLASPWGPANQ